MSAISTFNLCKQYKFVKALNDVNMTVNKGDIYGLIGRNGAGKTTLMRIICGLTSQTSGSFSLLGETEENRIIDSRAKMSAIIESPALYKNFTARENLQIMALLKGIDIKSSKIDELIELSGISKLSLKAKVKNFSLGMCQRLALVMAFLNNPEILILDEPVNGLDPEGIKEIRELLKQLNQEGGVTILISSHILSELSHLATTYGIIDKGLLIEEVSAKNLEEKMKQSLNIVLSSKEDMQKAAEILSQQFGGIDCKIEGDTIAVKGENLDEKASKINMALSKAEIMIKGMSVNSTDLEQYFLDKTREDR
ncbi:MAG: ATP-binding cassette domain-containing protein [Clostridia bacterium]|nr:ATP-binding cassette domain-containing protein [Clostridia bacterium]